MNSIKNFLKNIWLFGKKKQFEVTSVTSVTSLSENLNNTRTEIPKVFKTSTDVPFEKFYPIALVLLVSFFAADLTILYFRDRMLPTQPPPLFMQNQFQGQLVKARTEYTPITDRNIFNSDGVIPNPLSQPEGEMVADNAPAVKSQLPLDLVGTIVHVNPGKSVATIRVRQTNDVVPFVPNDPIENIATLIKVERRRAIIRNINNNRLEYIEIPQESKVTFGRAQTNSGAGIKQDGNNNFSLKRSELNNYLKNLPDLLQQATAVPNIVPGSGGEVDGFKMLAIEPNSVFTQIGIKVGDVIKGVNGEKVNNPAKAMELYNQLRSEGRIELEVERDGKPVNLNFMINE